MARAARSTWTVVAAQAVDRPRDDRAVPAGRDGLVDERPGVDAGVQAGGGHREPPAAGVDHDRARQRRGQRALDLGPGGGGVQPADRHAGDADAGGDQVAPRVVVGGHGDRGAAHEDEERRPAG